MMMGGRRVGMGVMSGLLRMGNWKVGGMVRVGDTYPSVRVRVRVRVMPMPKLSKGKVGKVGGGGDVGGRGRREGGGVCQSCRNT